MTKPSLDQFGVELFPKIFLYFDIVTWTPTLNLESLSSLLSISKSKYVHDVTSTEM